MAIKLASLGVELTLNAAQFVTGFEASKREVKNFSRDVSSSLSEMGNVASQALSQLGGVGGEIGATLGSVAQTATSAFSAFSRLGGPIGAIAGLGVGAAAGLTAISLSAIGITISVAEAAAKLGELSQATGVSTQTLAGLGLAAKEKGIDIELLAKSLEIFNQKAFQAAIGGTQGGKSIFARLGVDVKDAQGHLKNTETLFLEVADKIQNLPPGPEQGYFARALFGRGGAALLPVINEGIAHLKELAEVSKSLGLGDPETIHSAEQLKETLTILGAEAQGLALGLAKELLPTVRALADALKEWGAGTSYTDSQILQATDGLGQFNLSAGGAKSLIHDIVELTKFWVPVLVDFTAMIGVTTEAVGGLVTNLGHMLDLQAEVRKHPIKAALLGPFGFSDEIQKTIAANDATNKSVDEAANHWARLGDRINAAINAPAKNKTGFDVLDQVKGDLRNFSRGHADTEVLGKGEASKAFDDTLSKLKELESQTTSLLDKTQPKYKQELDKIQELIGKWEDYGTAWAQSHAGINTIVNSEIEALEKQRQKIQTNIDLLNKSLGLMQTSAGLVPTGEIPTLETAGIKPPPLPDSLLKPSIPIENLPIRSSTKELADILANRGDAAFKAEQKVLESLGLENRALVDQVQILKVLHDQGRLNDDEFALGMMRAKAALADINARTGGFADGAKAAIFDLAATWESQGDIMRRTMGEAFRGIEDNLAEMIVTGKARWGDFIKSLEVEFLKSEIHKGLATIAGTIANKLHIPGLEDLFKGKPDGTEANPLNVKVINGSGLFGGSSSGPSGDVLSSIGLNKAPGGLFGGLLGKIFGGGGGGEIPGTGQTASELKNIGYSDEEIAMLGGGKSGGGSGVANSILSGGLLNQIGTSIGKHFASSTSMMDALDSEDSGNDTGGGGGLGFLSGIGGFFKNLFSHFGGGMADGGDMEPGKWYVTGERHPEIIAPKRPMSVYASMPRMTGTYGAEGGGSSPEFHFHGVQDVDSFKRNKGQMAAWQQQTTYAAHLRHS